MTRHADPKRAARVGHSSLLGAAAGSIFFLKEEPPERQSANPLAQWPTHVIIFVSRALNLGRVQVKTTIFPQKTSETLLADLSLPITSLPREVSLSFIIPVASFIQDIK